MKSRLAVSFVFFIVASTFTSDAISDFKELGFWTGKIYRCLAVNASRKVYSAVNHASETSANSPDGKNLNFAQGAQFFASLNAQLRSVASEVRKVNYHCATFGSVKTSARRIRQTLGLAGIR